MMVLRPLVNLHTKGFNLLELLIALAVAAVLLGLLVPTYCITLQCTRAGTEAHQLGHPLG
ncbi:prepilin-type N-terminal cleavage/methylation domain-containing protein [Pseudomonas sp. Fl5BN2]|uniref:prepilin-type N-terminal cleavage/methylation domain-containing protein n=1 Tax=Pseudomonas sp. Fl5BN2 TaxID=2697652 RepID=UPI00273FC0D2|nr:prepilin-type N-terminal cleavage/methylation domain-containing protein [Pseudomonas sp. Fl5BN2]